MNNLPELEVLVSKLPNTGRNIIFEAEPGVLPVIQKQLDVEQVTKFQAKLLARPWKKGGMALKGDVLVNVTQACVVTSEPVRNELQIDIDRKFLPSGKAIRREQLNEEGELVIDPDAFDLPDEFHGDKVGLWDSLLEEIILNLDPFPRAPGAEVNREYQSDTDGDVGSAETHNPFAGLNTLINKKNSEN